MPETIAVRERFLCENGSVFQIAASAMDASWATIVNQTDEPVLVIIEGCISQAGGAKSKPADMMFVELKN